MSFPCLHTALTYAMVRTRLPRRYHLKTLVDDKWRGTTTTNQNDHDAHGLATPTTGVDDTITDCNLMRLRCAWP
jgi:hypothetical protein